MPTSTAQRAEDLITAKIRRDQADPAFRRAVHAEHAQWGRVTAQRIPELADLAPYNKARGVNEDSLPHLDEICAFFTDAGVPPTLEVWAGDASERLGAALARRGLFAGAVSATLHLDLDGQPHNQSQGQAQGQGQGQGTVTVEELAPSAEDTDYFDTLVGGYEIAEENPTYLAMLRAEQGPASVRRYLARVDGRPAAAASLYATPDGAMLSGAATLPGFRRQGCQSALILRRLADAAAVTDLAIVTVAFGSASHANLERVGFRQTHTRTAWSRLDLAPGAAH